MKLKTSFADNIFRQKYALNSNESWDERAKSIVRNVCGRGEHNELAPLLSKEERSQLVKYIQDLKFLPGGRTIYYAGRDAKFYQNCALLDVEDSREGWAKLVSEATSWLMSGSGIGVCYDKIRPSGRVLTRTGGISSGPISLMRMVNEIGRQVMQGGSRRSAMYASLNWQHEDASEFLKVKNWDEMELNGLVYSGDEGTNSYYTVFDAKMGDFNYPAPLDMTNISLNYDDAFLDSLNEGNLPETFVQNCYQACKTSEPGFSFNFGEKENETLRNACTEIVSEDNNDVCNLGSINLGAIESITEFADVVELATKFLVCITVRAELPVKDAYKVRDKNRRLGLGLMGMHEWLLKRNSKYEVTDELHKWLRIYKQESDRAAKEHCNRLYVSPSVAARAIAPTGTLSIIAGTTGGIEPLYATAYKRRYIANGSEWRYEYVVDTTAKRLIDELGLDPESIETALSLASDPERRIKFQYDVQKYVDQAISSTINLPKWGTKNNNEDTVIPFAKSLAKYAHGLRGFTCYADGSRGGQPLSVVDYNTALKHKGTIFIENSDKQCISGVCGV